MRMLPRLMFAMTTVLAATAEIVATLFFGLAIKVRDFLHEALVAPPDFLPRLTSHLQPKRLISMVATALNDRQVGGVHIHGFLGRPTVRSLTS